MGVEECATGARENLLPQKIILLVKSKKDADSCCFTNISVKKSVGMS